MERFKNPIICALDSKNRDYILAMAKEIGPQLGAVKIGLEAVMACGLDVVDALTKQHIPVFLDLKFHDIPNTVAQSVSAVIKRKPSILTIHASGGQAMMEAAVEAVEEASRRLKIDRPIVVAVTALTSLDQQDLKDIGVSRSAEEHVVALAQLAKKSGVDGVVCSAQEAALVRQACGDKFVIITPGIRPSGAAEGDQKRVMTPSKAIENGANLLVVGRPITQASDPLAVCRDLVNEVG